jgi:DNA-binding NarL/FixJ family response regulator
MRLLLAEDNQRLRPALAEGLEATGAVLVVLSCASGEEALELCLAQPVDVMLLDVQLAGRLNGIETAEAIRRELPRMPVVFYSIQDDDSYYRDFQRSGILTHFAYVRKSNYLLPTMLLPLLRDALDGRSFIDPDIASRVSEVRRKDQHDPMALLEPVEQAVARLLAQGKTNEQIATQLGFRDKRTISRVNGQIYASWGLSETATDEKVARTRASIIAQSGQLLRWDEEGTPSILNEREEWVPWTG